MKQNGPAKKNWPISARTLKNCMASVQVDWIGGHSFGFVVEDVLPDYTDEPESELEDEDDLEL